MNAVMAAAGTFIHRAVPEPHIIMRVIDIAGSPIVIAVLFGLMFKILPEGYIAWRDVWVGATGTAALFSFGRWAIGLYLGGPAMASMYRAASSLMAILVWVYYSALIFSSEPSSHLCTLIRSARAVQPRERTLSH
jgi:membrane protein